MEKDENRRKQRKCVKWKRSEAKKKLKTKKQNEKKRPKMW